MMMPERKYTAPSSSYRYGFNGIEKDNDCGCGEKYSATYRQYDPRLGRWMSPDPEMDDDPDLSPYINNENNPLINSDPEGDCPWCPGAFFKALVDAGIEIAGQRLAGTPWNGIDWTDVGVSAAQGFVSGMTPGGWVNTSKNLRKLAIVTKKVVQKGGEVVKAAVDNGSMNSAEKTIINYGVSVGVNKAFNSKRASKLLKPTAEAVKKTTKVATQISKRVAQKSKAVQTAIENGSKNSTIQKKVGQLVQLQKQQVQSTVAQVNAQVNNFAANTAFNTTKETTENLLQEGTNTLYSLMQKGEFSNTQASRFFNKWVNGGNDRIFLDYDGNQWRFTGKENTFDPKNIELVKRKESGGK